jgi:hypothetical protein
MTGRITAIHEVKMGNGAFFQRVIFDIQGKWAKTDVCPNFSNYKFWDGKLKIGNVLDNLQYRDDQTINADVAPVFLRFEAPPQPPQMTLFD